jgi:hypothetical protein
MSDCEGCAVADRYLSVIGLEARWGRKPLSHGEIYVHFLLRMLEIVDPASGCWCCVEEICVADV